MSAYNKKSDKTIINLEKLNSLNHEGCPSCGRKFNLGDPVVMACGAWEGGKKLIHESEAFFDEGSGSYVDRHCHHA